MPAAYFFTSYAHLDNNKHTKLAEVCDELRERVRAKIGAADATRVGFFDLEGIETGAEWVARLSEHVAGCSVFVCFCSNTYFNREICGKEFDAFRRRLHAAGAPKGAYLIPVIWDKCTLPLSVQQYSPNHINLPDEYYEDGLCTLQRVRRATEYETAIEALATAIAAAKKSPKLPAGVHPIDFDDLQSAFDNPDADAVRVAVLSDQQFGWEPDVGFTVRVAVEAATAPDRLSWRQFSCGVFPAQTIAQSKPTDKPLILVVPHPEGVWVQKLKDLDEALAKGGVAPCAVLLGASASAASEALKTVFPTSLEKLAYSATFDQLQPETLTAKIREAIYRLRAGTLASGQVAKVRDPQLESNALDDGMRIGSNPVLAGPGATP